MRILAGASALGTICSWFGIGGLNCTEGFMSCLFSSLFAPLLFLLSFGLLFWLGFLVLTLLADFILFNLALESSLVIILETLLIGGLFVFWGFYYDYPLWFFLVGIYVASQWLRWKTILHLLEQDKTQA
ncbi:hypothetical protein GKZ68_07180 [Hymenobacter sp. BRD128]|uniref:hypothetical protein n=1 Tax=Hymenobacter sp. BRD128 TaxID=2675878 RepID=UPI00156543A1|nr:hypothetical protein [Hymenobacter sp. BRD128]QKG56433.1 hypothetical protein GKZ68_07180 [Hymenobacter sp. BRD128]